MNETDRVFQYFERSARGYDRSLRVQERILFGDGRRWICSQASGDVLEIAVGTGLNFPHYGRDVSLTGIDLSPAMLALAQRRAWTLDMPVSLRLGNAEALAFPDERFDTVVCTLALCSIPDDQRAVAECRRVLRPSGQLLLLEHVRSPRRIVRWVEQLLDPIALGYEADHLLRDPLDYLEDQGFAVEQQARSRWGIVERVAARKCG
jgi:ubiquinone/menaquinone biosynthesis C-methylase UbiE